MATNMPPGFYPGGGNYSTGPATPAWTPPPSSLGTAPLNANRLGMNQPNEVAPGSPAPPMLSGYTGGYDPSWTAAYAQMPADQQAQVRGRYTGWSPAAIAEDVRSAPNWWQPPSSAPPPPTAPPQPFSWEGVGTDTRPAATDWSVGPGSVARPDPWQARRDSLAGGAPNFQSFMAQQGFQAPARPTMPPPTGAPASLRDYSQAWNKFGQEWKDYTQAAQDYAPDYRQQLIDYLAGRAPGVARTLTNPSPGAPVSKYGPWPTPMAWR